MIIGYELPVASVLADSSFAACDIDYYFDADNRSLYALRRFVKRLGWKRHYKGIVKGVKKRHQ